MEGRAERRPGVHPRHPEGDAVRAASPPEERRETAALKVPLNFPVKKLSNKKKLPFLLNFSFFLNLLLSSN